MIFTLLIIAIILFRLILGNHKRGRKAYCIIIALMLIFIAGFRSMYVGIDSITYVEKLYFQTDFVITSNNLLSFLQGEYLYKLLLYIINSISSGYTLLFIVIASLFAIVTSKLIYEFSEQPVISYLLLLSIGYFYFSMTGQRQTIAMCICFIALILYLKDKKHKNIKFIILVCLASLFHISALIFLMIPIINLFKFNWIYFAAITLLTVIIAVFGESIVNYFIDFLWSSRVYTDISGGSSFLILLIFVTFCMLTIESISAKRNKTDNVQLLMQKILLFSIPLQALALYQANAFRVAMYFHIVMIIIIPNVISHMNEKTLRFLSYSLVILLSLIQFYFVTYHSAGIIPFSFVWDI